MPVTREDLRRFLDGHATASGRLRAETLQRLAFLTVEEARAEYDSLCRVWEESRPTGDAAELDRLAIRDRVRVRRLLDRSR